MKDFWLSCGHHLLDRDEGGGLLVTDEFLKAYLARPELAPPSDACIAERSLHAAVLTNPRRPVSRFRDRVDRGRRCARELGFDDRVSRSSSSSSGPWKPPISIWCGTEPGQTPPLFINQLVHVILRNLLDGCEDAIMLRAAELLFRPQRLTVHDGSLIAADEETVAGVTLQPVSPLVAMLGLPAPGEIEVIGDGNAETYWERSDLFDMALDLTAGRRGLDALGEVIGQWITHLLSVEVDIEPLTEATGVDLTWYVGLDAEASRIGDALWNGEEVDAAARERIVGLYRLGFRNAEVVLEKARGEPIYLILAMSPDRMLRMKPQNLVAGLPIAHLEMVS